MKKLVAVALVVFITAPSFAEQATTIQIVDATEDTSSPGTNSSNVFVTLTRTAHSEADLPTFADVVKPEKIKELNAQNAGEAVAQQTSVLLLPFNEQLGSALNVGIRGSTSDQTLVLIDGRPMEGVALGTPDLSEVPVEQIDHIEILRSGASALYGPNAMGGVINIITKKATYTDRPVTHLGFEAGSFGRQLYRMDVNSHVGPVDYFFFGKEGWESGFRDNSDARFYNLGGNASVSMGGAGKLVLDTSAYRDEFGVPSSACGPGDPNCLNGIALVPNQFNNKDEKIASSPSARQLTDSKYLRSSYLLPLPANALMTLQLFGSERNVQFNDANDPNIFVAANNNRHEQSHGGEVQFDLPLGFMVGGNFIHDREDNIDLLAPANSFMHFVENYGIFAQEEFHYATLTLIPSGRYDHNSQAGDSKNPRVQLIEDATPWLRLSGSAGRSFRAPTIDQLFFVSPGFVGNPSLRPETAWTYDAGFEVHQDSFSFRTTYFRSNVSDLIQVVSSDPSNINAPFVSSNVGSARRQGAEIQIDHAWCGSVKDSLNYTYLQNVGIPVGFDHLVDLPFSPRHTVNYVLNWKPFQGWQLDNTARFEDKRFSGNDETGTKLGSEFIWGMRLAYQWRQTEMFLGVNDLANKRYQEQPGFPLPGRTFYGGVTVKL